MKLKKSFSFFLKSPFEGLGGFPIFGGFSGLLLFLLFLTFSCQKEEKPPVGINKIILGNTTAGTISYTTATVSAAVESVKGNKAIQFGHCWGTAQNPLVEGNKTTLGSLSEAKTFASQLENLLPNTSYYIRAYVTTPYETIYGNETSFKTIDYSKPTVSTIFVSGITPYLAVSGGNVTADGGLPVTARGVVWNTTTEPTITSKIGITSDGTGIGSFTSQIINLQPGITYYVRSYAINSKDTGYGEQFTFTTKSISAPEVTTAKATDITTTSATTGGNVTNDGNLEITARGVCWKLAGQNPTINDSKTTDGTGIGSFISNLTGLQPNADYYLRAYATNSQGTTYGEEIFFTTSQVLSLATVTTSIASSVTSSSAVLSGIVTNDGNATVTERGVCYSTSQNPTTSNMKVAIGSGVGAFSQSITGLTANTTYYVRAYAINSQGTAYGNEQNYKTNLALSLASLTTSTPTNLTSASATLGGNITSDGNATVTERGICYSTSQNPTTISSTKVSIGSGTGTFSNSIAGLTANTSYYVRAYAINSQGTAYGNEQNFKTSLALTVAALTTAIPANITSTGATLGGDITSDGNATVTERGICYSTSQNPTTSSIKLAIGSGTGTFSNSVTGLTANTSYYVRAYAINTQGTAYGNELSFKTSVPLSLASLTTSTPTNLTSTSATLGGNVSSDGNATVTERGICYSTTANPTTSSNKVAISSGTGAFSNSVSGLTANTNYYVRAYAINSQGTAYGNEVNLKTSVVLSLASLTTSTPTDITSTSATLGGNVSSDGNATVTERGICYSTSQNPTTSSTKLAFGSGTGTFSNSVAGLNDNTTYYVRAYAINSQGTAYGNEVNFKTDAELNTVTDIDGNVYNTVTIGTQVWMVENLKTTKYNDNTAIPLVTGNATWAILRTPAYCWYKNDATTYKNTYGALYNWYAVNTGKLAPTGWHVPSDAEWTTLTNFLGGEALAGGRLKESGYSHWISPNTGATNETGFSALPAGLRYNYGPFDFIGLNGLWWSSTEVNISNAWSRYVYYDSSGVGRYGNTKEGGFSVRCVKD